MYSPNPKRTIYLLIVVAVSVSVQAMGQTIAKPENQELTLTGVIREVHGYGPPGYGEDKKRDSHITYWALELPRPINLPCTPEKPEWAPTECVSERQPHLFFAESPTGGDLELKAKSLKDSRALVTGVLHRADTAGEITAIYTDVTEATEVLRRDNPAVAPPDKSDSFERNGNGEKFRVQHRELAGTNFRVAGVDLAANEEVLTQAARIFGKVPTVVTGDASTANERACYRSVEMNNAAYLLFDRGEVSPSFTLTSSGTVLNPKQVCLRTSKIARNTTTEAGLRLGQTPDQVIAVLGLPTTRHRNVQAHREEMAYELDAKEKTARDDLAKLLEQNPNMPPKEFHENYDFYNLSVSIHATFTYDRLTYLKVDWSATY